MARFSGGSSSRATVPRLEPVTQRLRQFQTIETRRVTRDRGMALLGLLCILLAWPDVAFAYALWRGFPAVGYNPPCGIFGAQPAKVATIDYVFQGGMEDAVRKCKELRPSSTSVQVPKANGKTGLTDVGHDEYILKVGLSDKEAGWCTEPMHWKDFMQLVKGLDIRLIRRFVIQQGTGKLRVIDDAADGGQSDTSEDANKLRLCIAWLKALCWHLLLVMLRQQNNTEG